MLPPSLAAATTPQPRRKTKARVGSTILVILGVSIAALVLGTVAVFRGITKTATAVRRTPVDVARAFVTGAPLGQGVEVVAGSGGGDARAADVDRIFDVPRAPEDADDEEEEPQVRNRDNGDEPGNDGVDPTEENVDRAAASDGDAAVATASPPGHMASASEEPAATSSTAAPQLHQSHATRPLGGFEDAEIETPDPGEAVADAASQAAIGVAAVVQPKKRRALAFSALVIGRLGVDPRPLLSQLHRRGVVRHGIDTLIYVIDQPTTLSRADAVYAAVRRADLKHTHGANNTSGAPTNEWSGMNGTESIEQVRRYLADLLTSGDDGNSAQKNDPYAPAAAPFLTVAVDPPPSALFAPWREKVLQGMRASPHPHVLVLDAGALLAPTVLPSVAELIAHPTTGGNTSDGVDGGRIRRDLFHTVETAPFATCSTLSHEALRGQGDEDSVARRSAAARGGGVVVDAGSRPALHFRPRSSVYGFEVFLDRLGSTRRAVEHAFANGRPKRCFAPSPRCFFAARDVLTEITNAAHAKASDHILHLSSDDLARHHIEDAGVARALGRVVDSEMEVYERVITAISLPELMHMPAPLKAIIGQVSPISKRVSDLLAALGFNQEEVNFDPELHKRVRADIAKDDPDYTKDFGHLEAHWVRLTRVVELAETLVKFRDVQRKQAEAVSHGVIPPEFTDAMPQLESDVELLWRVAGDLIRSGHVHSAHFAHSTHEAHHRNNQSSADAEHHEQQQHPHTYPQPCVHLAHTFVAFPDGVHPHQHVEAGVAVSSAFRSEAYVDVLRPFLASNGIPRTITSVVSLGFAMQPQNFVGDAWRQNEPDFRRRFLRLATPASRRSRPQQHRTAGSHFSFATRPPAPAAASAAAQQEDDCTTLARESALAGAADTLRRLRLRAHKARFCGLLWVLQHGGVYMDEGLVPKGIRPLASWFNPDAPIQWSLSTALAGDHRAAAIDARFVAAQSGEACLHRALSGVVRAAESMRWDPVAFEDVGLGVWMHDGLSSAADECSPAHHSLRAGIIDEVIEGDNGNMEYRAVAANTRNALADVRGVPPLRIVVTPAAARWLTEAEHEAAQSFTEHEPKLGHLVVSDDECLRLFESEGPFAGVRVAYQRLPLRQRSHLCGLAAVHRYGGIYTHAYASWADDIDSWLPHLPPPPSSSTGVVPDSMPASSSRVTFVAAPSMEEGAYWDMDDATTASGDAASTWLFGAAPQSPAIRNTLAILDSRVRRLVSKEGDDSGKVPTAAFLAAVGPLAFGHAALQDATVTWVRFADCVRLVAPFHSHRQHRAVSGHAVQHRHRHQEHAHLHDDHDITAHRHLALLRPSAGTTATSYVGIPLLMWRAWHGGPSTLPLELRALTDPWHREEPALSHTLFNDSQCLRAIESELPETITLRQAGNAAQVSKADIATAFAEVPVSMLRGRLCRLVALFLHGGIYADLDVAWRRPVEEWIDEGTVVEPSTDAIARLWAAEQRAHRVNDNTGDGGHASGSSASSAHALKDDSHAIHYASGRLDAKAAAVQNLIAAAFGSGDHRRLVPGKPTIVTVAAPSSEHHPASLENAAQTVNWLTAATARHACIEEALGRAVRAILAHRHDNDPSDLIHDVERALPDAIQGCSGIDGAGQLGVLPHDYFELNFARHEPLESLSARQWRITVASMKARHAWRNHLTLVVAGRARQPREQRLWRSWRRLEPRMIHMRLTDADCYRVVLKHKDTLLPRLAANFWRHPAAARLNICRFVVVYEHGGVFADATIGLLRPLAAWFPLMPEPVVANHTSDDTCSLTIAPEFEPAKDVLPPLTKGFRPVHTDLFAAHRHCPCLRKVLQYMDREISEIPPQHWTDHRSIPERIGSAAFGIALRSELAAAAVGSNGGVITPAQDTACRRVPFRLALADVVASTRRDPGATAWRHNTIPSRRNTITPLLPPAQPFSVVDAMWHLEEPSLFRAVDTDCDLSISSGDDGRWRNLMAAMGALPFPLQQRICAVAMVVADGGYAIDPAAAFRQPMERWMPKGGTIVVTAANGSEWSRAHSNISGDAPNVTLMKLQRAEEDDVVAGVLTSNAQRKHRRLEDPYRIPRRPEEGPTGNETHPPQPAFSAFFFAATRRHPCLLRVLDVMDFRVGASIRRDAPESAAKSGARQLWTMQEYRNRSKVPNDPAVALFESWLVGDLAFSEGLETCGAIDVVLPFRAVAEEFMTYRPPTRPMTKPQPREWIPRVVHVVWKSPEPEGLAGRYHSTWLRNEPAFERRVVQDPECAELAQDFPEMAEVYGQLPLNVMRADVCRLLAVYRYGGIYMDLDVAWTTPLNQWLNLTREIVIAQENELHMCNWIFAARPRHPCLARTIRLIARRAAPEALKWARQHKYDFVHYVTGPRAFTDGMRGCAEPTLSGIDVTNRFVSHRFASTTWSRLSEAERGGFDSWRKERDVLWNGTIPPESEGPAV